MALFHLLHPSVCCMSVLHCADDGQTDSVFSLSPNKQFNPLLLNSVH